MTIITYLKGKKAYFVSALGVIYALAGFATGHITGIDAVNMIFGAASVSALRAGIANELSKQINQ
jgi:hypothetical protein